MGYDLRMFAGSTTVVTGGAGFLGSHLSRRLLDLGARVVVLDNLSTGRSYNIEDLFGLDRFSFLHYDVTEYLHVTGEVDFVLHWASPASPVDYLQLPIQTLKVGGLGTHKALGLARNKGARFMLASTSEVYGDPEIHPQPETYWGNVNPIGPRGVYDEAKRYAEALTFAYHRSHDLEVRVPRIFNSILSDEPVLFDDGHRLHRMPIGEVARRWAGGLPAESSVVSFDSAGHTVTATPSALVGHPPSGPCFRVTTRYGRTLKVTGDHSLFVEGPDGSPVAKTVADLTLADRVALARTIPVPERDVSHIDLADCWSRSGEATTLSVRPSPWLPAMVELTDELLWLLGLLVAEGTAVRTTHDAYLTIACEDEVLDRAEKVLRRDVGLHVGRQAGSAARAASLSARSRLFVAALDDLGFTGPKSIPGWVLGLPLTRLGHFLEGYREGDGVHSGAKLAEGRRHEFSTVSSALKDDLVIALGRFGVLPSVGRYTSRMRHRTGDREYPFWRLTVSNVAPWSPLDWHRGVEQSLQSRTTGDLVWAKVRSIEQVPATPLVWDFSVPGMENFLAGGAVMAHNTYGPSMRMDDGRAVPTFIGQALEGEALSVFGDGLQTRSLCYVDDLVEGLLRLLASDYTAGPVNIGNPHEMTMLALAEMIIELTGSSSSITHHPAPVDDPKVRQPDTTIARRELGWDAEVAVEDGLARTIAWVRRHKIPG
ncbi:hypothetical protein BH23ACT9_BH23ACT9_15970 [soil metagenome]